MTGKDWGAKDVRAYRDYKRKLIFYCSYCYEWHTAGKDSGGYHAYDVKCGRRNGWNVYWNGERFKKDMRRSREAIELYCKTTYEMIYFIQAGDKGPIKIGISSDSVVKKRLSALQTAHYLELALIGHVPGSRRGEARLHRRFSDLRLRGEWFEAHKSLVKHIAFNTIKPERNGR